MKMREVCSFLQLIMPIGRTDQLMNMSVPEAYLPVTGSIPYGHLTPFFKRIHH